jgi:hypothetical protein
VVVVDGYGAHVARIVMDPWRQAVDLVVDELAAAGVRSEVSYAKGRRNGSGAETRVAVLDVDGRPPTSVLEAARAVWPHLRITVQG